LDSGADTDLQGGYYEENGSWRPHSFAQSDDDDEDDCRFLHIRPEDKVVECPWYRISHAPTYPYTYTYTYTHTYTYTYTGLVQSDVIT